MEWNCQATDSSHTRSDEHLPQHPLCMNNLVEEEGNHKEIAPFSCQDKASKSLFAESIDRPFCSRDKRKFSRSEISTDSLKLNHRVFQTKRGKAIKRKRNVERTSKFDPKNKTKKLTQDVQVEKNGSEDSEKNPCKTQLDLTPDNFKAAAHIEDLAKGTCDTVQEGVSTFIQQENPLLKKSTTNQSSPMLFSQANLLNLVPNCKFPIEQVPDSKSDVCNQLDTNEFVRIFNEKHLKNSNEVHSITTKTNRSRATLVELNEKLELLNDINSHFPSGWVQSLRQLTRSAYGQNNNGESPRLTGKIDKGAIVQLLRSELPKMEKLFLNSLRELRSLSDEITKNLQ